jgi:hypothetical protein
MALAAGSSAIVSRTQADSQWGLISTAPSPSPFIGCHDLNIEIEPTIDPTDDPTGDPTSEPTVDPTAGPLSPKQSSPANALSLQKFRTKTPRPFFQSVLAKDTL